MRHLSKSKIIAYRQCPKRLWLEVHRRELRDDSGAEVVFAIGNEVGDVARQVYDRNGEGVFLDLVCQRPHSREAGRTTRKSARVLGSRRKSLR